MQYGNDLRARKGSPPQQRRGGRDIKKDAAKPPLNGADEVGLVKKNILLANTTSSARAMVASRPFLDRAATPPLLRRGASAPRAFAASKVTN